MNAICEIGVIVTSILNLISEQQNPESSSDRYKEELAIISVSLAITFITLTLTIVGAGSAMTGLKMLASRMSATSVRLASRRFSRAGNAQVAPVNGPVDAATRVSASGCAPTLCLAEPRTPGVSFVNKDPETDDEVTASTVKEN